MKQAYIVITSNGYWARGGTAQSAVENVLQEGARRGDIGGLARIDGDDKPYVNGVGNLCYKTGSIVTMLFKNTKIGKMK